MQSLPLSLEHEHREIREIISLLSNSNDEEERRLSRLLETHFQKEEEVLPPLLSFLVEFSAGRLRVTKDVLFVYAKLNQSYSSLLEDHSRIKESIKLLQNRIKEAEVLESLKMVEHHAEMEEEIIYPAARLAGFFACRYRAMGSFKVYLFVSKLVSDSLKRGPRGVRIDSLRSLISEY